MPRTRYALKFSIGPKGDLRADIAGVTLYPFTANCAKSALERDFPCKFHVHDGMSLWKHDNNLVICVHVPRRERVTNE